MSICELQSAPPALTRLFVPAQSVPPALTQLFVPAIGTPVPVAKAGGIDPVKVSCLQPAAQPRVTALVPMPSNSAIFYFFYLMAFFTSRPWVCE